MNPNILYEDNDILVCEKPAGVATESRNFGAPDMVSILKNHLAKTNSSTNQAPYLGLIHRLDQPVGGIMVFAKNKAAAAGLSKQLQDKKIHKQYLAVITNDLSSQIGKAPILLTDYLVQDRKSNSSKVVTQKNTQSKKAELLYQVIDVKKEENQPLSLIKVDLLTGRHHQIRVQTAVHLGGIWGDKKYNPFFQNHSGKTSLGLYSHQLTFIHPTTNKELSYQIFPENDIFSSFKLV